jgi:hypothetical protein
VSAPACWHCQGSGLCDCLFCGKEGGLGWRPGPCITCKGRAKWDKIRDRVPDPRVAKWWRLEKHTTGGFKRVFVPEELLDQGIPPDTIRRAFK